MATVPPVRKRLFFDIETSPNVGLFWKPGYKINITYDNIIKERAIICIAWKWAGEAKIDALTWDRRQSDKKMLQSFIKVMDQADEVVAHNGDRFDIGWLRTRCLYHGIPMIPNYTSLDTLKLSRGRFLFNSNRLDYIAQFLGVGKKTETDYSLWKEVLLNNSAQSLAKMVKYCKNDVVLLEKVWDKMNTYVLAKTSIAENPSRCPECNSNRTVVSKHRRTAAGYNKVQFCCKDCGKYHTVATSRYEKWSK